MSSDPLTVLLFRLTKTEEDVKTLQTRLDLYVPERENDLKLSSIKDTIERIGKDIQDVKESHRTLSAKLTEQQETQNKTQIRVLATTVTTFISILVSVLIGYITHFFH